MLGLSKTDEASLCSVSLADFHSMNLQKFYDLLQNVLPWVLTCQLILLKLFDGTVSSTQAQQMISKCSFSSVLSSHLNTQSWFSVLFTWWTNSQAHLFCTPACGKKNVVSMQDLGLQVLWIQPFYSLPKSTPWCSFVMGISPQNSVVHTLKNLMGPKIIFFLCHVWKFTSECKAELLAKWE